MVVVVRLAMVGVERSGGASDQDGAGDQGLQLCGLLEDILKRRFYGPMLSDPITS